MVAITTFASGPPPWSLASLDANFAAINAWISSPNYPTGLTIGSTFFDPVTDAGSFLLDINTGLYSTYTTTKVGTAYGFVSNIYRSSGSGQVVGGQFSAYTTSSSATGPSYGLVSQAWAKPGSQGAVLGSENGVINESSSGAISTVSFTGYISGTTMVVVSTTGNIDATNAIVTGAGVTTTTYILRQLSGVPAGTGTYQVYPSQTVSSGPTGEYLVATSYTAKIGVNPVFKDRPDSSEGVAFNPGTTTEPLGANQFNVGSICLWVTSQFPSTNLENCGWRYGIRFDEFSLSNDILGSAIGIDFAPIHYLAPGAPNPLNSYNMTAAIRLRDQMSILWNADTTCTNWNSGTEPTISAGIRTYYDSTNSPSPQWKLCTTSGGVITDKFGLQVSDGSIFMAAAANIYNGASALHVLGSGGFSTASWTAFTLLNSWTNYTGAGYNAPASYYIDAIGIVHLRGVVKGGTITTVIANLPVGYRPEYYVNIPVVSNGAFGYINISPWSAGDAGNMACEVGNNTYVCLDGISFKGH